MASLSFVLNPDIILSPRNSSTKLGYCPGEPMLHAADMVKAAVESIETPDSRMLRLTDMYRDFVSGTNQHYLKGQPSCLESGAGGIIYRLL